MNLKNKKVLVTGSSSGIGQTTAIEFAKKGAIVFINYNKNRQGAEDTLREVKKYSNGEIFQSDLRNHESVKTMIKSIVEKYENIDILINNAADYKVGDFDDIDIWEDQFVGILMTVVKTTSEFVKQTSGERKIINTASIYGNLETSSLKHPQYSAMKAAISNLTTSLAKKYFQEDRNITVNAVAPGWTWTKNWEKSSRERNNKIIKRLSIGRFVKTEEIAHTFIFLAENDAINGRIITVDGGLFSESI